MVAIRGWNFGFNGLDLVTTLYPMLIYPCTSILFFSGYFNTGGKKKSMNMFGYIIGNHPPLVLVSIKMAFEWNPVVV
jgi:hypothetical protein